MSETRLDLETWPRAGAYKLFRSYAQPHFSLTTRLDVSGLVALKSEGISPFRACLYAIATGFNSVAELRCRFRPGDLVIEHDAIRISPTIAMPDGTFSFGYLDAIADWPAFDAAAKAEIEAVRAGAERLPNPDGRDDLMYLSCLPWIDFTSMTNPTRGPDDCIPRISWGRFTDGADGKTTCALTAEVNHAVADGAHLAAAFNATQSALDALCGPR